MRDRCFHGINQGQNELKKGQIHAHTEVPRRGLTLFAGQVYLTLILGCSCHMSTPSQGKMSG